MKAVFYDLHSNDKVANNNFAMPSEILMENAANGMASFVNKLAQKHFKKKCTICIVAGSGDNAGDGLAMARMLKPYAKVKVLLASLPKSELCKLQAKRLELLSVPVKNFNETHRIPTCDILIDALLGTGFQGALKPETQTIINLMNKVKALKVAIDVPSGLNLDGIPSPVAFKAKHTLTAGALKLSLYSDLAKNYVGKVHVIHLGLPTEAYAPSNEAKAFLLKKSDIKKPKRKNLNSHKGSFGWALIYSGEKQGASILASMAALKIGSGRVSLYGCKPTAMPVDLMYEKDIINATAYCIGPGAGSFAETEVACLCEKLKTLPESKVVFDADALKTKSLGMHLPTLQNCIITPHPLEFITLLINLSTLPHYQNLLTDEKLSVELLQQRRFYFARHFSEIFDNIVLVLKGAIPIIAYKGVLYLCARGTPALSKAGTGDVLSGIITGLLAQGYTPLKAATIGTLIHAEASRVKHKYSFTASKLLTRI